MVFAVCVEEEFTKMCLWRHVFDEVVIVLQEEESLGFSWAIRACQGFFWIIFLNLFTIIIETHVYVPLILLWINLFIIIIIYCNNLCFVLCTCSPFLSNGIFNLSVLWDLVFPCLKDSSPLNQWFLIWTWSFILISQIMQRFNVFPMWGFTQRTIKQSHFIFLTKFQP